jgi:hypothetical protein
MPRATLSFDLPEENAQFRTAQAGREALALLHEIDQLCRDKLKHGELTDAFKAVLQEIRDMIPGELLDI